MSKFKNVAEIIRRHRHNTSYSQAVLSEKLGYKNGQFISNVERGLCSVPAKQIGPISDLLKINSDEIVEAIIADKYVELRKAIHEHEMSKAQPDIFAKYRSVGVDLQ